MGIDDTLHATTLALTDDPGQHPHVFARAFNTGRGTVVDEVYEPGGVLVTEPGRSVDTAAERVGANQRFLDLGLPIAVNPRQVYVADDIALLIVDWVIDGTDPDGRHVHVEGTATDVARRGVDGRWRYVIDNPFGTALGWSPAG
ncbi:YybH family protein [Cryptosporangium minutisporangium]|uniref:DUF4440 domain-containing protein n=1 Tax=Cryptosporangium minutisporangium TaxID=113569 RepID=A0ABP6T250_9ACTN